MGSGWMKKILGFAGLLGITLLFYACQGGVAFPTGGPNAMPTPLPYLQALEALGQQLPAETQVKVVYSDLWQGHELKLVEFLAPQAELHELAVFDGEANLLKGATPDEADRIFWLVDRYSAARLLPSFDAPDRQELKNTLAVMQSYRVKNRPLAGFAQTIKPIMNGIDKLKERILTNKTGFLKKMGIDEINVFDAICFIPVDAANLCLLEPVARLIDSEAPALDEALDGAIGRTQEFLAIFETPPYQGGAKEMLDITLRTRAAYAELSDRLNSIEDKTRTTLEACQKIEAFLQKNLFLKIFDPLLVRPIVEATTRLQNSLQGLTANLAQATGLITQWRASLEAERTKTLDLITKHP